MEGVCILLRGNVWVEGKWILEIMIGIGWWEKGRDLLISVMVVRLEIK